MGDDQDQKITDLPDICDYNFLVDPYQAVQAGHILSEVNLGIGKLLLNHLNDRFPKLYLCLRSLTTAYEDQRSRLSHLKVPT